MAITWHAQPVDGNELPPIQIRQRGSAVSGAERMRDLRRRNPDYDRTYKAKVRAGRRAWRAAQEAKKAAVFAEAIARPAPAPVTAPAPAVLMLPAPPVRLCLPAPVVDPAMAAIDALAMKLRKARVAVPLAGR